MRAFLMTPREEFVLPRNLHRAFQELVLLPVTERSGDIKKKRIDVTVKNGAIDIAVKG